MQYEPERITIDPGSVTVEWNDGVSTTISGLRLRTACPCAECREDRAATTSPIQLSNRSEISDGRLIGGYALGFTFADGHADGIYPFGQLRHLGNPEPPPADVAE